MTEKVIDFKTAKLAKEKKFNLETNNFYTKPNIKLFGVDEHGRTYLIKNISGKLYKLGEHAVLNERNIFEAPTQSLLQKWLREVHKINVYCVPTEIDETKWYHNIASSFKVYTGSYEEVLEVGLQEGLKLIV